MATTLPVTQIRRDGGTQARSGLDNNTLLDYRQAIQESGGNWPFPPIIVFYDGKDYWLADGFHRVQAAFSINSGYEVPADVRQGDQRDAKLFAAGANADHGLRRSNDDKQRAVMMLLDDPEWSKWSDREIARRCKVSPTFVGKLRPDTVHVDSMNDERTFIHPKTGKATTMKTKNIGSNGSQPEPEYNPPPVPADKPEWLVIGAEVNILFKAGKVKGTVTRVHNYMRDAMVEHKTQGGKTVIDNFAWRMLEPYSPEPQVDASDSLRYYLTYHPTDDPEYFLSHILQTGMQAVPDGVFTIGQLTKGADRLLRDTDFLNYIKQLFAEKNTAQAKQEQYYDPPDWFEDYGDLICDCGGDRKVVSLGYPAPPQKNYFKTSCLDCGEQLTWHQPTEIVMRDEPELETETAPVTANPYRDNVDRSGLLLPPRDESEPFEHHPALESVLILLQNMTPSERDKVNHKLRHIEVDGSKQRIYTSLAILVLNWKSIITHYDHLS